MTNVIKTLAVGLLALSALAPGAQGKHVTTAKVVETTPSGFTLKITRSGAAGHMEIVCPGGKSLGAAAFAIKAHDKFSAVRSTDGKRVYGYAGRFDKPGHVQGSGSTARGTCGSGVSSAFTEGVIGAPRILTCPQSSPEAPFPPDTPFTFDGVLPNAPSGTKLRIEYTDPNAPTGAPGIVHVTTDSRGRFSHTHAFPTADGGTEYGASATPRYPDGPLATAGHSCKMQIGSAAPATAAIHHNPTKPNPPAAITTAAASLWSPTTPGCCETTTTPAAKPPAPTGSSTGRAPAATAPSPSAARAT
jgi:hypothetical protein